MTEAVVPVFRTLNYAATGAIATVTLNHPPINLFDLQMVEELEIVASLIESDASVKVMVLQSADPDFFSAHADVAAYCENGKRLAATGVERPQEPTRAQRLLERFRRMPIATIAKVEGRLRGGGSCLMLAMDMCFAALEKATFGHPEIALGLLPAIGGSQRLPQRCGRARALEIILGGDTISAEIAERYGYINRALPADQLGPFVDQLAARIASYSATAIGLGKQAVDAFSDLPMHDGLVEEAYCFDQATASPEAQRRMSRYLENHQSREFELKMAGFVRVLAATAAIKSE